MKGSGTTEIRVGGVPKPKAEQAVEGELHAIYLVEKVDQRGEMMEFSMKVEKFVLGADAKEAMAPGKVIEVKRDSAHATYAVRGEGPVEKEVEAFLAGIYYPLKEDGKTDDESFGTEVPRHVGESWPVRVKPEDGQGPPLNAKELSGETKLVEVGDVSGIQMLRLKTTIVVKGFAPRVLPASAQVEESKGDVMMDVRLPVDAGSIYSQSELTMTMSMRLVNANHSAVVESNARVVRKEIRLPVKH
jgi:hypothetical protein